VGRYARDTAHFFATSEARRWPQVLTACTEYLRNAIDYEGHEVLAEIDDDPFRSPRSRLGRQSETNAHVHDGYDVTAVVSDSRDQRRRMGECYNIERIRNLADTRDGHRIVHIAHQETDKVLQRIMPVTVLRLHASHASDGLEKRLEIEQNQKRPFGPSDTCDMRRLVTAKGCRGFHFAVCKPVHLEHFVDQEANVLLGAHIREQDSRLSIEGRLMKAKTATQIDHGNESPTHADDADDAPWGARNLRDWRRL
jgi:hypothetical protein